MDAHVEVRGISKSYGGAQALRGVHLAIQRGTVHCLVGENGAGKSTLGKIVAGAVRPDAGQLLVDGEPARFSAPRDALARGITLIAQEIAVVPQSRVIDNVLLGIESSRLGMVDRKAQLRRFSEIGAAAGFTFPPNRRVGSLRVADQQKVEVLRALARNASLIVMDEPTAALTQDETARLMKIVRRLRDRGTTVIYVSHHLDEVLELADRITVLRNGEIVRTTTPADETRDTLVTAMLGRNLEMTFPPKVFPSDDAPIAIRVEHACNPPAVNGVDLEVRSGEILGVAGLIGSGRTELARLLFGADRLSCGRVFIGDKPVRLESPRDAMRAGIALLPESRKDDGLIMNSSIARNITITEMSDISRSGFLSGGREREVAVAATETADVRYRLLSDAVATLSGGNQQKVLFAKWMRRRPTVFIADEPTRGVDVGAKLRIHQLIVELAQSGVAVLLISSELEEVLGLAHRIVVMRQGRVVRKFEGPAFSEMAVMHAAVVPEEGPHGRAH